MDDETQTASPRPEENPSSIPGRQPARIPDPTPGKPLSPKFGPMAACWRGIVVGVCTGTVVACFRLAHDKTFARLLDWFAGADSHWAVPFIWGAVLFVLALVIGRLALAFPLIPGSGIPQIELALGGRLPIPARAWPRLLAAKFAGSWLALMGGLSLGREGPCVQMGSAVGALWSRFWNDTALTGSPYLIGGAAAGLAAAFGAPFAGVIFVFEEMKSRLTTVNAVFALAAAFSAQIVAGRIFGLGQLFPFNHFTPPPLSHVWTLFLLGIALGLLGVIYNATLIRLKDAEAGQTLLPQDLRTLPALIVAGVLAFTFPHVLGGGDGLITQIGTASFSLRLLILLTFLKFAFSIGSYMGNVPGGLLMPLLCIGALAGHTLGRELAAGGLMDPVAADGFIVLGMAGLFAAIVRAPLTGISLVIEMTGAVACLPGAFIVAFIASYTATALHCPPIYDSLKERVKLPG